MSTFSKRPDTDILTCGERAGQLVLLGGMALLFAFFARHQLTRTGFFTDQFGWFEMACLYVPIAVVCLALLARALTGNRNPGQLLEAFGDLCLAFGSLWLLLVFPFSYAHLADVLPAELRLLLTWVTDDIARIFLVIQVIVGFISAVVLTGRYFARRGRVRNAKYSL